LIHGEFLFFLIFTHGSNDTKEGSPLAFSCIWTEKSNIKNLSNFEERFKLKSAPFALIVQGQFPCVRLAPLPGKVSISRAVFFTSAGCWVSLGLSLHQLGIREYPFKSKS
jgi:hypothetical protein